MKLVINYDLLEEIKNAQEPYCGMKLIRCYKRYWIKFAMPFSILASIPSMFDNSFIPIFASLSVFNIFVPLICDYLTYNDLGDFHQEEAKDKLCSLISLLRENNINTDYDLLLNSELYYKKYNLTVNEDKIIEVLESKYILIPTYNYNMKVTDTSILQEHIVGSNKYVLSFGRPEKKLKLVMEGV